MDSPYKVLKAFGLYAVEDWNKMSGYPEYTTVPEIRRLVSCYRSSEEIGYFSTTQCARAPGGTEEDDAECSRRPKPVRSEGSETRCSNAEA